MRRAQDRARRLKIPERAARRSSINKIINKIILSNIIITKNFVFANQNSRIIQ